QKSAAAKVTLDFATDQHSSGFVREGKKASDPITIEFRTGVPTVRYEPDTEEAHKLPLTLVYESFKSIRLSVLLKDLSSTGGTKAANSKDMVGYLRVLLTGHERLDVNQYYLRNLFANSIAMLTLGISCSPATGGTASLR
ncbi:MAG: hypothetical protein Q9198_003573, partial [Flavoplaca austrocitrina]